MALCHLHRVWKKWFFGLAHNTFSSIYRHCRKTATVAPSSTSEAVSSEPAARGAEGTNFWASLGVVILTADGSLDAAPPAGSGRPSAPHRPPQAPVRVPSSKPGLPRRLPANPPPSRTAEGAATRHLARRMRKTRGRGFLGKMAASGLRQAGAAASISVKPIFSRDLNEAKQRVRELYRAWYREVPNTGERQGCDQGPEAPAQGLTAELRSPTRVERLLDFGGRGSRNADVPHTGTELPSDLALWWLLFLYFLPSPWGGESKDCG